MRIAVSALILFVAGCASTPPPAPESPPVPPMSEPMAKPPTDTFMDDVKNAVAGQLECPVEDINLTCLKRDGQGECVAVRGDGCNKTVEYQYGDPG